MGSFLLAAIVALAFISTLLFAEPMMSFWTGTHGPCAENIYLMDEMRPRADYVGHDAGGVRTVRIDPKVGHISITETSPDGKIVLEREVATVGEMVTIDPCSLDTFSVRVVLEDGSGKRRVQVVERGRLGGWKSVPDGAGLTATEAESLTRKGLADDQCSPPDQ